MNVMDKWKIILQPLNIDERYVDIFSQYCEKHARLSSMDSISNIDSKNTLPISISILKTLYLTVKNIEIIIDNGNMVDDIYLVTTPFSYDYLPSEEEVSHNLALKAVDIIRKKLIETNSNKIYISNMLASNLKANKDKMTFDMILKFSTK